MSLMDRELYTINSVTISSFSHLQTAVSQTKVNDFTNLDLKSKELNAPVQIVDQVLPLPTSRGSNFSPTGRQVLPPKLVATAGSSAGCFVQAWRRFKTQMDCAS